MEIKSECKNPWLCAALGFFLPLIGLIISAIIGKGDGVKNALGGIFLRYALFIGGCLFIYNAAKDTYNTAKDASHKPQQTQAQRQSAKRTKWIVDKELSPLDDSTTYTVVRDAETPTGSRFRKERPTLIIRHKEGKSEAYITWPSYLSSRKIPVTVRFDKDAAITEEWNCSTDGKAIFSPFDFADFLETVITSKRLVVRLTPFGESPETATFDISGLADALDDETLAAFGRSKKE